MEPVAFELKRPRLPAFGMLCAHISFGFFAGAFVESWLHNQGINTTGLGIYVMAGTLALLLNALIKLHIIIGWIGVLATDASTKTPSGLALNFSSRTGGRSYFLRQDLRAPHPGPGHDPVGRYLHNQQQRA